jgi:trehalose 6-phosphate phosphatase
MTEISTGLRIAVAAFAARPRVLIAVDFDGTLSPFVLDPMQARAVPGGVEALLAAAALAGVTVAVVSGRDLTTLEAITGISPDDGVTLIGSHGAQLNLDDTNLRTGGDADFLDEDAAARLSLVKGELEAIKARYPAVRLEHKPSAVVLHTRGVEPSMAAAATAAASEVAERHPGVHVMPGKNVVELTVLEANKGNALLKLARATGSDSTLYVGDDVTDERAFSALDPASGDLTVKVGDGETVAAHRVPDQVSVVELLELFVDLRGVERRRARG